MNIGYVRSAIEDQDLTAQMDALKAAGCEKIFADRGMSGLSIDRPGLS
jgi:DNA invertase Pin-like site-specific DNA recombinase